MTRNPKGPISVDAFRHGEKRPNIPTADAHDFYGREVEEVRRVVHARDASLDPQLVWRGKYPDDPSAPSSDDLVADAPPIYIQEKIDPRVLIENLRRTEQRPKDEPELALFESFDGLPDLDVVEFYRHQANWSNRMILGDSLQVMSSLAEREALRGQVQMVYIDPPYGIKFGSNWQVSARKRDVKDGKLEDATLEVEQIKAFRDTWELGIHSYLSYLRDRLVSARELLTESGSCFVQIGDENVHLVRSLLDEIFGSENFVSCITMKKTTGAGSPSGTTDFLAGISDYLLWYGKDKSVTKYRRLYRDKEAGAEGATQYNLVERSDGTRASIKPDTTLRSGDRVFAHDQLTSQSSGATTLFGFPYDSRVFYPGKGGWKTTETGMGRLAAAGRLLAVGNTLRFVRFLDDFPASPINNIWTDTVTSGFGDPKVYVVQTLSRIVERCMLMCTDPGDLVLDPTCGSGTTAYVAEQWGRRWITVDTSRVALALARQRIMGARYPYYLMADSHDGAVMESKVAGVGSTTAPVTNDIRHGFVYQRIQHVTLKSIANNPDIQQGISREEVGAAIKRHADYELLYDRPYEDKGKVRVAGPFTVESLSPHRALSFGDAPDSVTESGTQVAAADAPDATTFEQSILENLMKAGIQNGRRKERIQFATLEPYAGVHIQAAGERSAPEEGSTAEASVRIGVAVGPQYGTVDAPYIKAAAREAIRAGDIDLLCVLGFAFDPQATNVTQEDGVTVEATDAGFANVAGERRLGRVRVLLVRMNSELLMGEDLKKTGAGNLFTVFGEPDIDIDATTDGRLVIRLNGVDVYDPTTGQVRSNDTDQIALWMIDTDYNEESFFVRHCYFTGGHDPYKRLKVALKADIDAEAWASLYSTESRPFDKPSTGKVAVKVINDYGDEVMKVFEVS